MKNFTSILFFFLFLNSCAQKLKSDDNLFNDAYADYQTNKASCRTKLLDYTKKYPNDYKGWSLLGTVSVELDNDTLGQNCLNKALELNSTDVMALTELGVIERKRKNYDKAAKYYNQAIEVDSTFGRAYASLMLIELKRGNYQKAVELGEKGVSLEPGVLYMKAQLALAYHFNKQIDKSEALMKELKDKGFPYADNYRKAFEGQATLQDF